LGHVRVEYRCNVTYSSARKREVLNRGLIGTQSKWQPDVFRLTLGEYITHVIYVWFGPVRTLRHQVSTVE
jgi:hypothetical protein